MSRPCTICTDARRSEIDTALVSNLGYRAVAKQFGLSESATYRHREAHLPMTLKQAHEAQEVAQADSLLDEVKSLQDRGMRILCEAEDAGDLRVALQAIREVRAGMELIAKLMGQLDDSNKVTINIASEWPALRSRILDALELYPEARAHLVAALSEVERC